MDGRGVQRERNANASTTRPIMELRVPGIDFPHCLPSGPELKILLAKSSCVGHTGQAKSGLYIALC